MVNSIFKVSIFSMLLILASAEEKSCKQYITANLTIKDGGLNKKPPSLVKVSADNDPIITNCERWLLLDGGKISRIEENVFDNLLIAGLEISEGNSILIHKNAFNGLPILRSLIVRNIKPLFLLSISSNGEHNEDQEAFQPISNITHLEYPFYDEIKIKRILTVLEKIKSFKMTGSISEIKSDTFTGVSPSLMHLEVATFEGMKIYSGAFSGLKGLTELIFTNTIINHLAPRAFEGTDKLENLFIWFNLFSDVIKIQKGIFNKLKSLNILLIRRDPGTLFSNSTMEIERSAFSGLTVETLNLRYLSIGQPFRGTFDGLVVKKLHVFLTIDDIKFGAFEGSNITNLYIYGDNQDITLLDVHRKKWKLSNSTAISFKKSHIRSSFHMIY